MNGRVLVRMPISLHSKLVKEAKREKVSLNQLCVTKLATALNQVDLQKILDIPEVEELVEDLQNSGMYQEVFND